MTVGLTLGSLDLMDKAGTPFAVATEAEGTEWGNPQPIEVAIRSLLQDGSIVAHEGDDNREVTLRVRITAPDSAALAQGEAALMAELYKRNDLTYTPSDGWSDPTVFDVVTSSLTHTMDDLGEVQGRRIYSVRLVCLPFGRSETATTVTPTPTSIGTSRQEMHTVTVGGSARTEASLALEDATNSPGRAVVYSFPDDGRGYSPPLLQFQQGGVTVADTDRVSGSRTTLELSGFTADVPSDTLYDGRHLILGLIQGDTFGPVTVSSQVSCYVDSVLVRTEPKYFTTVPFSVIDPDYQWVLFGVTQLPLVDVRDQANSVTRVVLKHEADGSGVTVTLDEALLVNMSVGALTQVDMVAKRLFIEPSTVETPRPRLLQGNDADRADAYYPGVSVKAWGQHMLEPGSNKILTVAPGPTGAALTASWFDRWHTHAGS